ncbi:protease RseP [Yersinia pestis]|uniref:Protease RseP n=16 Tax=Yersinia pseudotuberculosis complex TaxID=1649845 RepID=RSEP_YERPE|nr:MULTISPECIES: sigma E protease regulator RseP [Yersinia pseudotuberculosis complex]Q8ZH59.1 RecName: Full=Protease RseP; AltName: Full=S2P endopeptidase; AltName: Full=Site-2 protease RseP; Short=S2P protease RseP; AltName: Full=Site-2-type intramembrane protease [Yersinia pestis]EDR30884.1 RIP metalloprotease RseP [Yersinia pestis biovar Orientalis str. IP275]EFA46614.1 RIP metalloprotease RseP [Yersinia pestis KIM D27]ERP76156.1 zinc metallopeptidase RseP [Yersinia pestis S3]ERP76841.1 zi
MMSILWSLAAFIVALGILITVHEFGHFWVARRCGVRVERFSIGFGKALWRRTDRQGTEYVIALIPLGGYVKMLDERVEAVAPELRHQSFNNKTVLQRAAIVSAGPIANFLFAIVAYWLVFIIGVPSVRPVIGDISPQSIAAQANISSGMELKSVDGIETPDWDSVRLALISRIGDKQMQVGVAPFGSDNVVEKTLDLRQWQFEPDKQDPVVALGIIPRGPQIESVLAEVQPGSAAQKAGLQAGDRIVKVNGQLLDRWQTFVLQVRDNPGQPLVLDIERESTPLSLTLIPDTKSVGENRSEGFAGVVPKVIPLPDEYKTIRQYGPFTAVYQAGDKTWQLMRLTVSMLGKLITGDVKLNNLSGPISIAQGAGLSAEYGLVYYLMFLALISVNLGIINLFPLPVLDGGHLLFLAIEKLKGGPVSERVQDFSYRIGSILLVLLMGLALFNDFSRL